MKNQYFADIGDFGKYGLLRFLANQGIIISINWYMTCDDGSNDGHFRQYLDNGQYRNRDPQLFDELYKMHQLRNYSIEAFEEKQLIPNATYYQAFIDSPGWSNKASTERLSERVQWHKDALAFCRDSSLIFLDPDNGLSKNSVNGWLTSPKYVFVDEALDYYRLGSDLVYYCHKGRRDPYKWNQALCLLKTKDPSIHIRAITFHKGTQRTYVFAVHPERAEKYDGLLARFLKTDWGTDKLFTLEL